MWEILWELWLQAWKPVICYHIYPPINFFILIYGCEVMTLYNYCKKGALALEQFIYDEVLRIAKLHDIDNKAIKLITMSCTSVFRRKN